MRRRILVIGLGMTLVLGAALRAAASDGAREINQTAALAGAVTPGDTAGFPVTISQAGSYLLTGNLVVPSADTTASSWAARRASRST